VEQVDFDFKYFELSQEEKQKIIEKIKELLISDKNILFAFIHGSFLRKTPFRDIDVALFLSDGDPFDYVIKKSVYLETHIGYPIDIHVLNEAPITFEYYVVTEGKLLFTRNKMQSDIYILITQKKYLDFSLLRKHTLGI